MRWMSLLGAAVLLGSAGCGNALSTDPAVFVEATVQSPTVDVVQTSAIQKNLTGGFTLKLHLGPRASGAAEVNLQGFALVSLDQKTVIVDSLPLKAQGDTLPIMVEPDSDEEISILIDDRKLDQNEVSKVCSFSEARFTGTLTDSLRGGSTPVVTGPVIVTMSGCTTGS
jgi:hypothetical protein